MIGAQKKTRKKVSGRCFFYLFARENIDDTFKMFPKLSTLLRGNFFNSKLLFTCSFVKISMTHSKDC